MGRKHSRIPIWLIFAVFLPIVQACQSTDMQRQVAQREVMRISVDPVLGNQLVIGEVNTSFTEGNLMLAQLTVGYARSVPASLAIEYKVDWYDERGQLIPTVMSRYNRVQLQRGQPHDIRAVAPGPQAVDFSIFIRPLKR